MDEVSEGCVWVSHLLQLGGVEGDDEVSFGQLLIVRCKTRMDDHVVPRKGYHKVHSVINHNILLSNIHTILSTFFNCLYASC